MRLTPEQIADLDRLFGDMTIEVSVHMDASPEIVWDLVSDVGRIGEFSLEAEGADWIEGATGPAIGARFLGNNRVADFKWARVCTVVACERGVSFAYEVGDRFDGSRSGQWSYRLEPEDSGTKVTHRFAHEPTGRSGVRLRAESDPDRAEEIVDARKRYLGESMLTTLEAMRRVVEGRTEEIDD